MELVSSPSDGDCLFTSVIFGLKQIVSSRKYETYNDHLKNLGLCFDLDISLTILHLRNFLVSEWLENAPEHEEFVTTQEISFKELANSYRRHGVFEGELGNIMAVGLASVLRINMVLFTSMEKMKTIQIVLREKVLCNAALYLAFNNCGCGHNDAVVESIKQDTSTDLKEVHATKVRQWNRREKAVAVVGELQEKKAQKFCFQVPGQRRSQCPCLPEMKKCSSASSCFNCNNPHGANHNPGNSSTATLTSAKRNRGKQSLQGLRKTSLEYMLLCGEKPKDPTWKRMEKCVLKSLYDHLAKNGEFTNDTDLTSSYNELVSIVN